MSKVFVLGANDPEMRRIEEILRENGKEVRYAEKDGKRCHPGNAYQCDRVEDAILVECAPVGVSNAQIDHHRPGDPGYGLPASEFWEASSLGQLWRFLQLEGMAISPSHEDLVLAAMDHNPAGAIRGGCPGVSAQDVIDRKVSEISAATKVSPDEVRERIRFMSERLENASEVVIGRQSLKDLREFDNGVGYNLDLLTSQVATLAGGYAVLLSTQDREGGAKKWTVAGHAAAECVEAFKDAWAPAQGLTGIYGVPSRGYAGGYLAE